MSKNLIETIMGAVVLLVALLFMLHIYKYLNLSNKSDDYIKIKTNFFNIGSLSKGGDVRLGGVKIGNIADVYLNKETLTPVVMLNIQKGILIPKDSRAVIKSTSLIGSKYIYIMAGSSDKNLKNKDIIKYTQDALDIEDLINKFAFSGSNPLKSDKNKNTEKSPESL